jgi:hypothetical protein
VARLPPPPPAATLSGTAPARRDLPAGSLLFRIYFRGGRHPATWNAFRAYGPTGARFDHHTLPRRAQARGIHYGAVALRTCVAEVFQQTGVVDVATDDPAVVAYRTAASLRLLDLSGHWPTAAGASMAINSGSHARARAWSRAIYAAYPDAQGLWYCSSMDASNPCVALYERAAGALPATPALHLPLSDPRLRPSLVRFAATLGYRPPLGP